MPVVPCTSTPPVTGIVVFDPAAFVVQFPEFSTVPTAALQQNFASATLLLNNTCSSRVIDGNQREALLNWLTAHVTALQNGVNGTPAAGLVGRIADAAEGSVRVAAQYSSNVSESEAFFVQTKYGAFYWQAIAAYRTFLYVPAPAPACMGGPYYGQSYGPTGSGNCGYNGGSS